MATLSNVKQVVQAAEDLGCLSEQLAIQAHDLESAFAFSRQRHALLRPLSIRRGDTVLEFGASSGALTRYLGECGANVTAYEPNYEKVEIARSRCRDLSNVHVVTEFPSNATHFDWIVVADQMSEAHVGWRWSTLLPALTERLSETGNLFVAAENRIGLKYLLGARSIQGERQLSGSKRHTGKSSAPIDLETLRLLVLRAGLDLHAMLLPFPDHYFATSIVRASALDSSDVELSSLILGLHGRDYGDEWYALLDEHKLWGALEANNAAVPLANSIALLAARPSRRQPALEDADIWRFSIEPRRSEFAKALRITPPNTEGRRRVEVSRLGAAYGKGSFRMQSLGLGRQCVEPGDFYRGLSEASLIYQEFGAPVEELASAFGRWARYVLERAVCRPGMDPGLVSSWSVDGGGLELVPQNMIWAEGDGPKIFDQEWRVRAQVPLAWILYRGVVPCERYASVKQVLGSIIAGLGLLWDEEDFRSAEILQRELGEVIGLSGSSLFSDPIDFSVLDARIASLEHSLEVNRRQLASLQNRRSVRVALRIAAFGASATRLWRN
jgi:2-polyprenyl-3-methyl-5-hydroxy-6-metoxy-1,4-benzoquinol methylase